MTQLSQGIDSSLAASALAKVRFSLAPQVTFSEQHQRGEIWVIIQNNVSNKHFSTTPLVRDFVEQFRSSRTLLEVLEKFSGYDQLPPEEWLELLSKLMSADILNSPDLNQDDYRLQAHLSQKKQVVKSKWSRPWMIKIPLGNPNKLLNSISKYTLFIWTVPSVLFWICFVLVGALEAVDSYSELQHFWATRFLDPTNIMLALVIYPILKFFHELGHGLAAKRWGADVVETGILLILFVPLPYVDVSQSVFFPKKHQRILVAAAGMMFELFIAVGALMLWLVTDNILLQDICMNIILIGAVSSIFFNANPLLKFDGYYILSDFLEIPNLSARAALMTKYVLYHRFFKIPVQMVAHSLVEARWLFFYGVMSQVYRLLISFSIALYLGSQYFFIGTSLALWLIATQMIKPWFLGLNTLIKDAKKFHVERRVALVLGGFSTVVLLILFVVPFQFGRTFNGILMLDGAAQVQANASGFIREVLVEHNAPVKKDQALFRLVNSSIDAELSFLEGKIAESVTLDHQYRSSDPAQSAFYKDQTNAYRQEWENLKQELQSMVIRSPVDGYFQKLSLENYLDRYVAKGDRIGDVLSSTYTSVVLMLTEEEMKKVAQFNNAHVLFDSRLGDVYKVAEVQATPGATDRLPSPFLGTLYGGSVAVDSSKNSGLELLKPMFKIELAIDALDQPIIGSRALVKLPNAGESLGLLIYHKCREVLRAEGILE